MHIGCRGPGVTGTESAIDRIVLRSRSRKLKHGIIVVRFENQLTRCQTYRRATFRTAELIRSNVFADAVYLIQGTKRKTAARPENNACVRRRDRDSYEPITTH